MKKLALLFCLPLLGAGACMVGDEAGGGGGGGGGGGSGSDGSGGGGGGGGTDITGHITQDAMWMGNVKVAGITTIDPGVNVTVAAGTTITVVPTAYISVSGTLDLQGTSAEKIHLSPETAGGHYGSIDVGTGGTLKMAYVIHDGGSIQMSGGTATITDTQMSRASGDFLKMSGGSIDVSYSSIGLADRTADTTHCDMHFGGSGNIIKFVHSSVSTSSYGIMFYGGTGADFSYNNWFSNTTNVDTQPGSPVSGDFSNSYFEGGKPTAAAGSSLNTNNVMTSKLAACTGTNNDVCAGPRP